MRDEKQVLDAMYEVKMDDDAKHNHRQNTEQIKEQQYEKCLKYLKPKKDVMSWLYIFSQQYKADYNKWVKDVLYDIRKKRIATSIGFGLYLLTGTALFSMANCYEKYTDEKFPAEKTLSVEENKEKKIHNMFIIICRIIGYTANGFAGFKMVDLCDNVKMTKLMRANRSPRER